MSTEPFQKCIVFVGCGHCTSLVLQSLMDSPPPILRVCAQKNYKFILINDSPFSVYSGMIPGVCQRQQYQMKHAMLAIKPFFEEFLKRTGISRDNGAMICAKLLKIDKERQEIWARTQEEENQFYWTSLDERLEREASENHQAGRLFVIPYHVLFINIGSQNKGASILRNLVAEHNVLPTRPISHLPLKVQAYENKLLQEAIVGAHVEKRLVVVGDGAAAFELACVLHERFTRQFKQQEYKLDLSLVSSHATFAEASGDKKLGSKLEGELKRRHCRIYPSSKAIKVTKDEVITDSGHQLQFDLLVWAVGAAPIEIDYRGATVGGFFECEPTLQCVSEPRIFAVGDCAFLAPWIPKAGVYSVRQAPVAQHNLLVVLEALIKEMPVTVVMSGMKKYDPQKSFLRLYNVGDGTAISIWKGLARHGRASWLLKDWIDRKFMKKFHAARVETEGQMRALCESPHSSHWEMFVNRWEDVVERSGDEGTTQ